MIYIVSITSQGQISIPAKIRKALNLSRTNRAIVSVEKNKIIGNRNGVTSRYSNSTPCSEWCPARQNQGSIRRRYVPRESYC